MLYRDILKQIKEDGWFQVAQKGSHRQFTHAIKPGRVTVAGHPSDTVPPGVEQHLQTSGDQTPMKYAIIYEKSATGFGAYIPDLPGCAAVGRTLEETKRFIEGCIEMHLAGMREDGDPIPEPTTEVGYAEVA